MSNGQKKPPISLSKLRDEDGDQGVTDRQPGELSYQKPKNTRSGNSNSGSISSLQMWGPAILAVILAALMVFSFTTPKKDAVTLLDNQQTLQHNYETLSANVSQQISTQVDSKLSAMNKSISTALTESQSAKDIASRLNSRVTALENAPKPTSTATAGITMAQVAQYVQGVLATEKGNSDNTTMTPANSIVSATIQTEYLKYIYVPAGTKSKNVPVRVIIANNSNNPINDIALELDFSVSNPQWSIPWSSLATLDGSGSVSWELYPGYTLANPSLAFINGWGLNVAAKTSITLNLTLHIALNSNTVGYTWQPSVKVVSYMSQ